MQKRAKAGRKCILLEHSWGNPISDWSIYRLLNIYILTISRICEASRRPVPWYYIGRRYTCIFLIQEKLITSGACVREYWTIPKAL